MSEQQSLSWHEINFFQPITKQSVHNVGPYPETDNKPLRVKGPAIHAVTTRNGTTFTTTELAKSAQSLIGKPILKDHENSVDSIVGKVTDAYYSVEAEAVMFEGLIYDEKCKQMIEEGLITAVSIGAMVADYEELYDEEGNVVQEVVIDIEFVEISLVAVPADPKAGVAKAKTEAIAISESYKRFKSLNHVSTLEQEVEEQMEEKKQTSEQSTDISKQLEGITSMVSEALGKFEATTAELTERVNALAEKVEAVTATEQAQEAEVTEEAVADETVSEVATEQIVENNDTNALVVERGTWSAKDYKSFGAVRLTR